MLVIRYTSYNHNFKVIFLPFKNTVLKGEGNVHPIHLYQNMKIKIKNVSETGGVVRMIPSHDSTCLNIQLDYLPQLVSRPTSLFCLFYGFIIYYYTPL